MLKRTSTPSIHISRTSRPLLLRQSFTLVRVVIMLVHIHRLSNTRGPRPRCRRPFAWLAARLARLLRFQRPLVSPKPLDQYCSNLYLKIILESQISETKGRYEKGAGPVSQQYAQKKNTLLVAVMRLRSVEVVVDSYHIYLYDQNQLLACQI